MFGAHGNHFNRTLFACDHGGTVVAALAVDDNHVAVGNGVALAVDQISGAALERQPFSGG